VVLAAGESQADPEIAQTALAQLCQTYWAPLYTFVRSRGYSMHDAQDLTQSFFAFLIERKIYTRVDRQKGKFRSFLLASLKNFLADAYDCGQTLKRGGGADFLPLDEQRVEEAESLFQTYSASGNAISEDRVFERSWAETLVTGGLNRLAAFYKAEGKEKLFEELRVFLTGSEAPLPSYAALAVRLGTQESTLRSHVTRLRARYREALRAEVRHTVETDGEVDAELRELLRVLTAS
jgi:DNA-directed RNA polymerase specialized sigma24 family protein